MSSSGVVALLVAMLDASEELGVDAALLALLLLLPLGSKASRMHSSTASLSILGPQMEPMNPSAILTLTGGLASARSETVFGASPVTDLKFSVGPLLQSSLARLEEM